MAAISAAGLLADGRPGEVAHVAVLGQDVGWSFWSPRVRPAQLQDYRPLVVAYLFATLIGTTSQSG